MLGIAAVNAWYLFNSYRRYDLRHRTVCRLPEGILRMVMVLMVSSLDSGGFAARKDCAKARIGGSGRGSRVPKGQAVGFHQVRVPLPTRIGIF